MAHVWFSLAPSGGKDLLAHKARWDTAIGHLSLPGGAVLPLPPPMSHLPPQLSPCALFPALARLFYTRTPMRRSSCPLECQVSPWEPLVLPSLGRLQCSQLQECPDALGLRDVQSLLHTRPHLHLHGHFGSTVQDWPACGAFKMCLSAFSA